VTGDLAFLFVRQGDAPSRPKNATNIYEIYKMAYTAAILVKFLSELSDNVSVQRAALLLSCFMYFVYLIAALHKS